ncbi:hypothetical protein Gorai_008192, partial [Gossypium raimondii]|nr:hypothetical protein [Gossypium raimondii]
WLPCLSLQLFCLLFLIFPKQKRTQFFLHHSLPCLFQFLPSNPRLGLQNQPFSNMGSPCHRLLLLGLPLTHLQAFMQEQLRR